MRRLVEGIQKIVALGPVGPDAIAKLEALVTASLPRLQATALCTEAFKPGRYLCYKDPGHGFVIMILVWGKGDGTPIHDHGTWGVEAVLKHSLKVTNYDLDELNPKALDAMVIKAGDVMHNLPPSRDVHKVEHNAGDFAMSMHIYGREMTGNRSFVPGEGFKVCKLECRELSPEKFGAWDIISQRQAAGIL